MKSETLFYMIGTIKEEYISEAATAISASEDRISAKEPLTVSNRRSYVKIARPLAACAAALLVAVTALRFAGLMRHGSPHAQSGDSSIPDNIGTTPDDSGASATPFSGDLQLPTLPLPQGGPNGCGFEGYLAYSPDELVDTNPWNETMILESLPVYRNHHVSDGAGMAFGDAEELKEQVREIASRLDIRDLSIEINTMGDQGTYEAVGTAPGITIRADAAQEISIYFQPALRLPDNLNFTYSDSSYDDMQAVGAYLAAAYADLLQMENPTVDITGGDYSINGDQEYRLRIYNDSGDITQRLISHDFQGFSFFCNADGELWIIRAAHYDLSEKIGNYPLITPVEAKNLLCQGHYLTTSPVKMPGEEYVVKTELLYRPDRDAEYFMPYYRFLVELSNEELGIDPDGRAADLKTYGAYYVPAVWADYLSGLPMWDGSFN